MKPADFTIARTIADKLMATCQPSEHWDELNELTQDQYLALDRIAFECQTCNHWFTIKERHDIDGRYLCKDCSK